MILARTAAGFAIMVAAATWSVAAGAQTAAPAPAQPPAAEGAPPSVAITWDRAANIKEAAERIGLIQRTRGAEAAIKHIDACYRTHGLASAYSAAFEACIAQDYMETKTADADLRAHCRLNGCGRWARRRPISWRRRWAVA